MNASFCWSASLLLLLVWAANGLAGESVGGTIIKGVNLAALTSLRMDWEEAVSSGNKLLRTVRYRLYSSEGKVRIETWSNENEGDRRKSVFIDNGVEELSYDAVRKLIFKRQSPTAATPGTTIAAPDETMPVFLLPYAFRPGAATDTLRLRRFEVVTATSLRRILGDFLAMSDEGIVQGPGKNVVTDAYRWSPLGDRAIPLQISVLTTWNGQGRAVQQIHELRDAKGLIVLKEEYTFKSHKTVDGDAKMVVPMIVEAIITNPVAIGGREFDMSVKRISSLKSASIGGHDVGNDLYTLDPSIADAIYDTDTGKRLR